MPENFSAFRRSFFDSLGDVTQLLRLLDFVPDIYAYVKDDRGRFVAGNRAWLAIRGAKTIDDIAGKTDADLHPIYWARQYQQEDRRVMESGGELPDQLWLVPSGDGKLATLISTKIPLRSRTGKVIGIAGIMYRADKISSATRKADPIERAVAIIADRFSGPLEVAEIAAEVGLSVSQLNRRFRAQFQVPPSEYLQRVRVDRASRLLAETDTPILDVALRTGFFDQAHLTRTFRRWMEMTPNEFRRSGV